MKHLLVAALPLLIVTPALAQESEGAPGAHWNQPQTRAEAEARAQMVFDQLDANHDGAITQDEVATFTRLMGDNVRMVARVTRMFGDADANHDGKLTAAEAKAHADAAFDAADTNHDGTLTPEERQAARARNRPQQ